MDVAVKDKEKTYNNVPYDVLEMFSVNRFFFNAGSPNRLDYLMRCERSVFYCSFYLWFFDLQLAFRLLLILFFDVMFLKCVRRGCSLHQMWSVSSVKICSTTAAYLLIRVVQLPYLFNIKTLFGWRAHDIGLFDSKKYYDALSALLQVQLALCDLVIYYLTSPNKR